MLFYMLQNKLVDGVVSNLVFFDQRLDKKVYTSGETASLHIDVKNNSNVDIDSFIVKVTSVLLKVFLLSY